MKEKNKDTMRSKLMIAFLMLFIAAACSIQKLLDPLLHVQINEKLWLLGLELFILILLALNKSLLRHWKEIKWLWIICGIACIPMVTGAYKSMILNGMALRMTVFYSVPYFYALLSIPVALLLRNGDLKLNRLLQWIVLCSMISYGIRILISWYFGKTGTLIFSSIALEGTVPNWIRKGVLRVNSPVFAPILLPCIAWLFSESKENWKRVLYLFAGFIVFYFSFRIHQARAFMLYQGLTVIVIWLSSRKKITWKECLILAVLAVLVMRTEKFQEFVFSLSLKNTGEMGTTVYRVNALRYFIDQYLKSPMLGLGYLDGDSGLAPGGGHIADIGLLQTVFTMGVSGIFYIGVIAVYSGKQLIALLFTKKEEKLRMLLVPLIIAFWLFNINVDQFCGYSAYSFPFFLALINGLTRDDIMSASSVQKE